MPTSYSWPLTSPPEPAAPAASDSTSVVEGGGGRPRRGLLIPFRRGSSDYETGEGLALVSSDLALLLGTRRSSSITQGELPWRTDFGSLIQHAVHQNNDIVLTGLVRQWSSDAVARWMPSVRIVDVRISTEQDSRGHETIKVAHIDWILVARGGNRLGKGATSVPLTASRRA